MPLQHDVIAFVGLTVCGLTAAAVGWLDVWGNGRKASASARRSLADLARLLGPILGRALPKTAPGE